MQQDQATLQGTLRMLRTTHGLLMLFIVFCVVRVHMVPAQNAEPLSTNILLLLGVIAIALLVFAQVIRSRRLRLAFETLRTKPDDAESLARWRYGVIFSDVMAVAVVLYGYVIHFMGGTNREAAPFFIAGAVAMLVWWPREP
ncbi:MAG: hypothetical protein ACLQMT_04760 [Candidatus Acidiferrales bacterium]